MSRAPRGVPALARVSAYVPGEAPGTGSRFRLASNENPLGCAPAARRALRDCAGELSIYPDGGAVRLRKALADSFGLDPERIICGAGSDDIIHMLVRAFVRFEDRVVQSRHAFLVYALVARLAGARIVETPEPHLCADIGAMLASARGARIVFLANPNNPTGTCLSGEEIARLHAGLAPETLLVLDGAYAEYVTDPDYDCGLELACSADNVVVTRTFSKIHGLAALRAGWAYAPRAIIAELHKVRSPFNISMPAQTCALAALSDTAFVRESARRNARERARLAAGLEALGLSPVASEANFVLARFGEAERGDRARTFLEARGIVVRGLGAYRLPGDLRITLGTGEAVDAVLDGLRAFAGT